MLPEDCLVWFESEINRIFLERVVCVYTKCYEGSFLLNCEDNVNVFAWVQVSLANTINTSFNTVFL